MQFGLQGPRAYDAGSPGHAEDARIQTNEGVQRRPTPLATPLVARRRRRDLGQSVVEFTLVVPILLVLFIAIADFGRVFAVGVAVEAATRDAAEATANEYLANPPNPLDTPASAAASYYDALHAYGQNVVCSELRGLPNTDCANVPAVIVCVHDGADTGCGSPHGNAASCGDFTPAATSDQHGSSERWVEVRTCYHFTPILQLPLFAFGDVWLQRTRNFTIPCYFVLGDAECG
jgi:hypothetical protein